MKPIKTLVLLLICLMGGSSIFAQGWEKLIDLGGSDEDARFVFPVSGGYVAGGNTGPQSVTQYYVPFVFKIDENGQRLWTKILHPADDFIMRGMVQTAAGDYLMCGTEDVSNAKRIFVARVSATGDSLWFKVYTMDSAHINSSALVETSNGQILVALNYYADSLTRNYDAPAFLKLTSNGDSIGITIPDSTTRNATNLSMMANTYDHNTVLLGYGGTNATTYLAKMNEQGDTIWTHTYPDTTTRSFPQTVIQTRDSGFVITGLVIDYNGPVRPHSFLRKVDKNGVELWYKKYIDTTKITYCQSVTEDAQGRLAMADHLENPDQHASYHYTPMFRITDANGNELKRKVYTQLLGQIAEMEGITTTPNGGFIMVGGKGFYRTLGDVYVIKVDSSGRIYPGFISGKVYADANHNCTADSTEPTMPSFIIQAAGNNNYYTNTDSNGYYSMDCDTGTYRLSETNTSGYWVLDSNCLSNLTFQVTGNLDTLVKDIAVKPILQCPYMQVQVSASFLRICIAGPAYVVNYCNLGTQSASGVYTDITIELDMVLDSSSAIYTALGNNVYRFNLGSVGIGDCGSFTLFLRANCNVQVHTTHCVSAHIYPDSACAPMSAIWDHSHLELQSTCNTDSLQFRITNTGTGNMNAGVRYSIIQDDVLYAQASFTLQAAQQYTVSVPANGSTWTFITTQTPGHPGNNRPMLSIEGCGVNPHGTISTGYMQMYPQNDLDPFFDILCIDATTSHDPNSKTPEPKGLSASGQIDKSQPITYTIAFQNTGTDTAFTVVVIDTLSPMLDISTLRINGASHPYAWTLRNNVLEFDFYPIFLPDSAHNEPASNGFVSFTISPKVGLPVGSAIENTSYIYFDANPPVQTNTTLNTIGELYKTWLAVREVSDVANSLHCYPNPSAGQLMLEYKGDNEDAMFTIYDVIGNKVFEQKVTPGLQQLNISCLNSGVYIYKLTGKGESASGKITKF